MIAPEEAVDLQLDVMRSIMRPDVGLYLRNMAESMRERAPIYGDAASQMADAVSSQRFQRALHTTLNRSRTYLVRADMCDLVADAASTIPRGWTLRRVDLPASEGFILLERPRVLETDVGQIVTEVVTWSVLQGRGVLLAQWAQARNMPTTAPLLPVHFMAWTFERSLDDVIPASVITDTDGPDDPSVVLSAEEAAMMYAPWIAAFWLFTAQRVGYRSAHDLERKARRRARRAALPDDGQVEVVHLRRRVPVDPETGGGPRDVNWTHRWSVSGHWRNQWYPSENRHKPVWIAPYVKGPDDLPYVPKDRVYLVDT